MKSEILTERTVFTGYFNVLEAQVTHDSLIGKEPINATRLCMERGDSVAILVYEKDTDCFLFTQQYRYPTARRDQPFVMECVAGSLEMDEKPDTCARRECLEELGYALDSIEPITTYFPSPGGCSEQIYLFYGTTTSSLKKTAGGGLDTELEDIKLIKIPASEIKEQLTSNLLNNSISIIALQWYLLRAT